MSALLAPEGGGGEPLLAVRDLSVRYRSDAGVVRAVQHVSFDLSPGRAIGIVGESGSGKSTIAGAILNLVGANAELDGEIMFEGSNLLRLDRRRRQALLGRRIGAVFQDPFTALNPSIRVGKQIAEPLIQHLRMSEAAAANRVCELLADMGIQQPAEVAAAYPHQLSGGMKQRALIAAALACEPPLLILDEPTTALDVTVEAQILHLLADLRRRRGVSLVFISHNLGVVRSVCDDLVVMYASQIVEAGAVGDVLAAPCHPYTKGLVASLPPLAAAARTSRLPSIPGQMVSAAGLPAGCHFEARCPFAEELCRQAPQALETGEMGRQVRCWKSERNGPWPLARPPVTEVPHFRRGDSLVNLVDLRKSFGRTGGLKAFELEWKGARPTLHYRPKEHKAVDGLSLSISPGEVVGLVGESGCGKSTLGRLALRLVEPTSGAVEFDGADVLDLHDTGLRDFRRHAQIIFQNADSSLNPRLSVGEALERPIALMQPMPAAARARRVLELLDMVRLPQTYRARFPHQLSGGEKQRVAIARALASSPSFIVCDEPVSALDVSVQAAIVNLLADLRDAMNIAYLFISHDLAVVSQLSDRIAVMYRGRLCEIGSTAEILAGPNHPYTELLLASLPSLSSRRSEVAPTAPTRPSEDASGVGCPLKARCPHHMGPRCDTVAPALTELSPTHSIACHLYGDAADTLDPARRVWADANAPVS